MAAFGFRRLLAVFGFWRLLAFGGFWLLVASGLWRVTPPLLERRSFGGGVDRAVDNDARLSMWG